MTPAGQIGCAQVSARRQRRCRRCGEPSRPAARASWARSAAARPSLVRRTAMQVRGSRRLRAGGAARAPPIAMAPWRPRHQGTCEHDAALVIEAVPGSPTPDRRPTRGRRARSLAAASDRRAAASLPSASGSACRDWCRPQICGYQRRKRRRAHAEPRRVVAAARRRRSASSAYAGR